jgi:hypothetical protein
MGVLLDEEDPESYQIEDFEEAVMTPSSLAK